MAKRPTTFSMRMPEDLNEKIQAYAAEHNCTKAEAMSHFARAGIEVEENGVPTPAAADVPSPASDPATTEALDKIQERLEALQNLPAIEPDKNTALVPIDIRDKIQSYSVEHSCTEYEALTYYARIGVQVSGEQRPANAADVAELYRRLDALAQDSQAKTEQMKQMAELLGTIRDYTKPDELELEGELAEQEAEDVEEHELTEEERQRIADEHTRQIVSDVMGGLLSKQRAEDEAARKAELEAQKLAAQQAPQSNPISVWIPVLAAVIVSLVIGLIVILVNK